MKKQLITWVLALATLIFKHKKYKPAVKKVNLACGMTCASGWFNIDGSLSALLGSKKYTWWNKLIYKLAGSAKYYTFKAFNDVVKNKKTYFYDLRYGIPLKDTQAEIIYCSHFLEHLNKPDGRRFLAECYRVLAPRGLFRLVLPDLDIAIQQFQTTENVEKVLDLFFYTSDHADFAAHKFGSRRRRHRPARRLGGGVVKSYPAQAGQPPGVFQSGRHRIPHRLECNWLGATR